MEARRRKRRAANVNRNRWLDRAYYFVGRRARQELNAAEHRLRGRTEEEQRCLTEAAAWSARVDDCHAKAKAWKDRSPM
jgi:hypothetical protein